MPYTVIQIETPGVLPTQVRGFGLYETADEAEAARRRVHLDGALAGSWSPPRTFVVEIGPAA